MVPFGGWEMPIAYPTGTVAEHQACREACVIFDVSHLGTVRIEGPDAFDRLQRTLTNDLRKVGAGRAQYTHLLDATDASVLDDIIVWWIDDQVFDVMPNASNTDRVIAALGGVDTTAQRAVLAVQGPTSRRVVSSVSREAAEVGRFKVARTKILGVDCVVAGTGYTGEDGLEIAVPVAGAQVLWDALVEAGALAAGLGARDTLRLEAGLPLHGHELGAGITSLQANLEWVVGWSKETFLGREALLAEKERGVARLLMGIATEGRRPPREGSNVGQGGRSVGVVTSGNFSPVLGHGIALAFLEPNISVGESVDVDVRGSLLEGRVVDLPFVKRR
jgi:aminomethyltransferase